MSQTLLADYAVPLDPRDVQAAGYVGVLRYVAPPDVKYDWKRFTKHERDAIFGQTTLGIQLVFESYAGRALRGAIAGAEDAHTAIQAAQALGYPSSVPLYLACDTDATADQVRPYYQAATSAWVNIGVYGGINVVDALLADGTVRWGWQTVAWSGSRVSKAAHLYQRLRPTTSLVDHYAGEFDEDVQLKPMPLWHAPTAVVAPPSPVPAQPVNPLPTSQQILSEVDVAALPTLRQNSQGQPVKNMQALLTAHGARITVDGAFGPITAQALRGFQANNHLQVDAVCGPQTWTALLER